MPMTAPERRLDKGDQKSHIQSEQRSCEEVSLIGIGRHTDYAARVILHLASVEPGALVPIATIADRRLLPQPFVRRIVRKLAAAGLVETVRGNRGGIRLARPAVEISLLDVVRALEGEVVLNRCVDVPEACPLSVSCPVQREWTRVTRNLEADLESIRFSDLVTNLEAHVTHHGYPSADAPGAALPTLKGRRRS
jgi:Rrf2 family iron-sulfur cluster assembly transcriptional regulator